MLLHKFIVVMKYNITPEVCEIPFWENVSNGCFFVLIVYFNVNEKML